MNLTQDAPVRAIFCPSCGERHQIPAHVAPRRRVSCAVCACPFEVPPPPRRAGDATGAHIVDLDTLPAELRALVGPPGDRARPAAPPGPKATIRRTDADRELMTQRAFDLDRENRIKARTGAGVFDLAALGLAPDDR